MNKAPTSRSTTAQTSFATFLVAPRMLRLALVLLAFAACCWAAFGVGRFLAVRRIARQPIVDPQLQDDSLSPLAAALPLAGMWSFDELDWKVGSQRLALNDVGARLEMLAATPSTANEAQLPTTDQEIVDLITALQVSPSKRFGNEIYRLERSDFKVQLVSRTVAGERKTVAFSAAYPHAGDVWQLYEFIPKSTATEASSSAPHLLPMPTNARRIGGRFAEDGRVLLELVSLDSAAQTLTADWQRAGWQIRPSGLAGPGDFSFLCRKGDDFIYAWSADPHDSLRNLMLVRTPGGADTSR
jgi:hypothetical protein